MIVPKRKYTSLVQGCLNYQDLQLFVQYVRLAYDTLSQFCNNHNNNPNCKHRISLSTNITIPTMSMVIIDPTSNNGELVVENI